MAMFGSGLRALLGGGQQMAPAAPVAQGGPRMFGGRMSLPEFIMLAGATAKDIGAGGGGSQNMAGVMDMLAQRRAAEAEAPLLEAKRKLAMEAINRQLGAYGIADTADLTREEQIALAFNPSELGKSFASGSDAYTLGRNDVRGFRNQPVMVNDAPPDPQVVSGRLVGADGRVIYEPPQFESVGENSRLVQLSPGVQAGGAPGGGFDAFYQNFLAPQEGGFAADDGNGAPVNFGINQGANPDIDVRNLTQDQAKKLLHDRYWVASGADRLPGGLAEIHGDTAVNMGVGAAQQLLQQSGGDPNRYLQLREQRYRAIAQADPSKARFLPTWMRRNQQLAQFVGGGQAGGGPRVVVDAAQNGPEWQTVPAEEAKALGPGQFQRNARTGEVKQITGTAPRSGQALAPQDRTFISEQRESAKQLQATIPLVDRFLQLNREVGTGAVLSNGAIAGVGAAFNPKLAEMKSIQDRLTPAMRQGMPGAASDRDVAMFRSATVGIDKPGNANAAVGKALKATATRQGDYVAFLEHYAQTNGSLLGAQEEWDAYAAANPMFDQDAKGALIVRRTTPWRQFFGVEQPKARSSQPSQLPQRGEGGFAPAQQATARRLAANPQFKQSPVGSQARPYAPRTAAEFKSIKPGHWYIDDDGQVYQKGR